MLSGELYSCASASVRPLITAMTVTTVFILNSTCQVLPVHDKVAKSLNGPHLCLPNGVQTGPHLRPPLGMSAGSGFPTRWLPWTHNFVLPMSEETPSQVIPLCTV